MNISHELSKSKSMPSLVTPPAVSLWHLTTDICCLEATNRLNYLYMNTKFNYISLGLNILPLL